MNEGTKERRAPHPIQTPYKTYFPKVGTMPTPRHSFKRPGLLRAGFQYQDLVAIKILIDFYRQPSLYKWVQVDAEDQSFRSIEDIVACRSDGLYELTQVKFTPDPEIAANSLSWGWLTHKSQSGTSLLQKWADTTLYHVNNGSLFRAALRTDRIPDESFCACLNGHRVQYALLSENDRTVVETQLGSTEIAKVFFDNFEFHHSQPRLNDLEDELWSRVSSDTDRGGWHTFRFHVQRWSTLKRSPEPDGRIRHFHLRDAFSVERSRPLPQDFLVPQNYVIPDYDFHNSFIEEISRTNGVTVLWGSPGKGKSTYLSHCVQTLHSTKIVCIRHHYFLSLSDRSEGRFHYHAIRQSLEHQLRDAIPDLIAGQVSLGELLERAACRLKSEDKQLLVIVDGLDHVWRDHKDREDMEALFEALLPVPDNMHLVVGTQKIANEFLPARLLSDLPLEDWTELPLMSCDAVHQWLLFHCNSDRMKLNVPGHSNCKSVLRSVARAFHTISHGLPLHLIYSFENMMLSGKPVGADDISGLPECPDGDIRRYYTSLWQRLKPKSKAILHVLAGLQFGPPPFAMHDCFGHGHDTLEAFAELGHLLSRWELQVSPFHGSLFAFLRDQDGHTQSFNVHAPEVIAWLESRAPDYWRWAWLWITRAQLGDPHDLLHGPNREWAIQSLATGYPVEQLTTILDQAEVAAFAAFDLPRFHALRSLSVRVRNGPEFQTHEWPLFQEVAVSMSSDPHVTALLEHDLHQLPTELIPIAVRCAHSTTRTRSVAAAISELNRRMSNKDNDFPEDIDDNQQAAYTTMAVAAHGGPEHQSRVVAFSKRTPDTDSLISAYAKESIQSGNPENVLQIAKSWSGPLFDDDVLAALCLEGLPAKSWLILDAHSHAAIRCLYLLKGGFSIGSPVDLDLSNLFADLEYRRSELTHQLGDALHELFFSNIATVLSGSSPTKNPTIPASSETDWLARAIRKLELMAIEIGQEWRSSGIWPTLAELYGSFDLPPDPSEPRNRSWQLAGFRLGFRQIAVDLCTIAIALQPGCLITENDAQLVVNSPYWADEAWLDVFTSRRLELHERAAVQAIVQRISSTLESAVTEFNERSNIRIKLALFALDHQLFDIARSELEHAIGCLLGYGYRKDLYANDILESLDLLAQNGDERARTTLLSLAGAFESICDYTDGDETDHARMSYHAMIAKYFPDRAAMCYASLIRGEEWRYAESLAGAVAHTEWIASESGQALLETFIAPTEVRVLERGSPRVAEKALQIARRRTGRTISLSEQDEQEEQAQRTSTLRSRDGDSPDPPDPDPATFPPERVFEFLDAVADMHDYDRQPDLVKEWIKHWECVGMAEEVLNYLDQRFSGSPARALYVHGTLDAAFDLAIRTRGRMHAFHWLVRAQTQNAGWSRWMSTEAEARSRLRNVATYYRPRWKEFVLKTARPDFRGDAGSNGLVIGLSRLVFFLIEIGENDLAGRYAFEMVRVFKEELSEQPIREPDWTQ